MLWKIGMIKNLTIYVINSMQVLKELEAGVWNHRILSDLFFDVLPLWRNWLYWNCIIKKPQSSQNCM